MSTIPIYIYDPTATDTASKVRGLGSYVQSIQEIFGNEWNFVSSTRQIPRNAIFINPFFNPLKKPLNTFSKISQKQIAVIHDLIPLKYPRYFPIGLSGKWHRFLNWFSRHTYDAIVTDSEHSKKDIVRILKIKPEKVHVVYPTVKEIFRKPIALSDSYEGGTVDADKSDITFAESQHATHLTIHQGESSILSSIPFQNFCVYVGDGTWNKNLGTLAKAVEIAQVPCVIVGKVFVDMKERIVNAGTHRPSIHPWEKDLYNFCLTVKDNPLFHLAGYVSDHDLVSVYKKAGVNILISYDEGFGLSFVEASYLGTPSILGDTPLFHETGKQDAEYADIGNPYDVAEKIRKVFFRDNVRKHLRVDVFERAYDFGPEQFRTNMQAVIDKLSQS